MVIPASHTVSYWTGAQDFPVVDWKVEVANDDTRLGYWDWREGKREAIQEVTT